MPQKFYDIIPPKEIKKYSQEEIKGKAKSSGGFYSTTEEEKFSEKTENGLGLENIESETENIVALAEKPSLPVVKKGQNILKKMFLLILMAGFLFVLIYGFRYYESQAQVQINIWPKAESLSITEEIIVDNKIKEPDFSNKLFPSKFFQEQRTGSQDFSSTGKGIKEEKAKGVIKVYNSFSDQSQTLLPQTRFVSAEGKLFKSLKRAVIPGAKYEKNKILPGSTDIEVQAAEAGQDYNIGPSTFSIPGFLGTAKYTAFYGKSFEPMTGGFRGEALQVLPDDLDKAREELSIKLKKEAVEALKIKIPSYYILLEKATSFEILDESSSAKIGSFADSFNFKETIKIESQALKKSDVNKFVMDIISSKVAKDKNVEEKNIEINFLPKKKENDRLPVVLEISVKTLPKLDVYQLKKTVAGKSFREINFLLKDNLKLSKIEIKPSVFWLKRMPENLNNIKINVIID